MPKAKARAWQTQGIPASHKLVVCCVYRLVSTLRDVVALEREHREREPVWVVRTGRFGRVCDAGESRARAGGTQAAKAV